MDTEIEVSDAQLQALDMAKGMMTLIEPERRAQMVAALMSDLPHARLAPGGSAANTIITAQQMGLTTAYSCSVASDRDGSQYVAALNEAGVVRHGRDRSAGHTGQCLVLITPDAERTLCTHLGVSQDLGADDVAWEALEAARWVYLEGYSVTSPPTFAAVKEAARRARGRVALSLSDPAIVAYFGEALRELLRADIALLFCNRAEAVTLTGSESVEQAAPLLFDHAREFVITLGGDGALVGAEGAITHVAGAAARPVDANGAGDTFAGAYLVARERGQTPAAAAAFANRAAAMVVSQFGPRLDTAACQSLLARL